MTRRTQALATTLALLALAVGAGQSQAATNGDKCAASKMKVAAKYASCRLAADAKAKSTGDPVDYTKCDDAQSGSWQKIEDKYGVDCITNGDQATVKADLSDSTECVTNLLSGVEGSCTTTQDPPCPGGAVIDGRCWVIGALSDSCNAACGMIGQAYDAATATVAGNPTDIGQCLYIASKLGYARSGSFGVGGPPNTGCAVGSGQVFLESTVTAVGSYPGFQRVCACQ